jgi:preprotein translocase subunit SecG
MLNFFIYLLITVHVIVSALIVLVTLMQRPKSEGLGAAFGGGMTENFFGAQTTNVLANFTRWMGGIFFAVTLLLSVCYAKQANQKSALRERLLNAPKPPAASATPPPKTAPDEKSAVPAEKTPLTPKAESAAPKQEQKPADAKTDAKAASAPAVETPKPEAKKENATSSDNAPTSAVVPAKPEQAPAPQAPK